MKLTPVVIADVEGNVISVNTSDNHSFIGKVLSIDDDNIKLVMAGQVGSVAGILNKDRTVYICSDMITSITILEK